jgi:hypothetical protein
MPRGKGGGPPESKQMLLPFGPARAGAKQAPAAQPARAVRGHSHLRVISGENQGRETALRSRDDVARLLMRSAADVLLRRISSARANAIQKKVDRVFGLFDASAVDPAAAGLLRRELDALEEMARRRRS